MNTRLLLVAICLATACKSRESTEVTVTTTGTGSGSDAAPAKPKATNRETLEKSMKKNFGPMGFTKFTCPEVANKESTTTCTIGADNGVSLGLKVDRTKQDDDGLWTSWNFDSDVRVISAEELAEKMNESLAAAAKKHHPKGTFELACGTTPIVFIAHKLACKLTLHKPEKVVNLTIDDSKGAFDWTADEF